MELAHSSSSLGFGSKPTGNKGFLALAGLPVSISLRDVARNIGWPGTKL